MPCCAASSRRRGRGDRRRLRPALAHGHGVTARASATAICSIAWAGIACSARSCASCNGRPMAIPCSRRMRRDPRWLAILAPLIGSDIKQIINQLHWKPPGAAARRIRLPPGCALSPAGLGLSQPRDVLRPDRPRHRSAPRRERRHAALSGLASPGREGARGRRPGARPGDGATSGSSAAGLDPARLVDARARSRRRRAVERLHDPRLGPQRDAPATAASISTAMSAPPIATAANGRFATARRAAGRAGAGALRGSPARPEPHYIES